jgi:hypothetical protein
MQGVELLLHAEKLPSAWSVTTFAQHGHGPRYGRLGCGVTSPNRSFDVYEKLKAKTRSRKKSLSEE